MKARTNITIEHDVLKKAQDSLFNISAIAEKAIKDRLSTKEFNIETDIKNCEFCGREGEPETAKTANKKSNGLSWLYPDEKWICNKCLISKGRNITK